MHNGFIVALLVSALLSGLGTLALAGSEDPQPAQRERGQKVFKQCNVCHPLDPSLQAGVGPNLYGIVGKKVGQAGRKLEFAYSQALLNTGATWTEETLDKFIMDPATFAPGTAMAFSGIKNEDDRKAVIEFLKAAPTLRSGRQAPR
jgi:cytochrome c